MDEFGDFYKDHEKRWEKRQESREERRDWRAGVSKEEEERMHLFGKRQLKLEQSIQAASLAELREYFKDFNGNKVAKVEVNSRNSMFSLFTSRARCTQLVGASEGQKVPGTHKYVKEDLMQA